MKKTVIIALALCLFGFAGIAQPDYEEETRVITTPKWVSEKGYWIIESNIKTPETSIVYFYTNDNTLVYKEKIEGVVLNVKKQKVKMRLKKLLEQMIYTYEQEKRFRENEMWVANSIKKS